MAYRLDGDDSDDEDWSVLATEQRREMTAAKDLDSDLDYAFQLQLQEAITASLSLQPSTSTSAPSPPKDLSKLPSSNDGVFASICDFQSEYLLTVKQEVIDRKLSESEFKRIREDLHRRIHDKKLAEEINDMCDDDWEEFGDNVGKPFGEGTSSSVSNEVFSVYFKGLVEKGMTVKEGNPGLFSGIGVAVCDSSGELLFELAKPVYGNGFSRQIVEFKALLEALNTALELDLKRLVLHCHYYPMYQHLTGRWKPKQRKIIQLVNQVSELQGKFEQCRPVLVSPNDIKFAFKLAREAIVAQVNKPIESSRGRSLYETCVICLEDTLTDQIFSIDGCMHRYCYSCMKQHVEIKMLYGMVPKCPHESCNSELNIDSCSKFLTPKLVERMKQRVKESSIPVTDKVYCPYPKCSVLMSKTELLESSQSSCIGKLRSGATRCVKCKNLFCISCKVPWHDDMTCSDYKSRHPHPPLEDLKLKNLAARNLWRQCIKCNHMIELATGCYHMTCRCGYEFCYTCGAEWKDKKATCSCPLWDENLIIDDSDDEDFDDDDDYESDFDDDDFDGVLGWR